MVRWEAGVDYLTTTWPCSWREAPLPAMSEVMGWAAGQLGPATKQNWVKPWAWQGYVGWTAGGCSVGEKVDSCIVRCSSSVAQDWLDKGLPTGHNVSRLDLQLTFWGKSDQDVQIARHNRQARQARKGHEGRPIKITHVKGNGAGDTLYLGSRASETFVRVYNKEKEQVTDATYEGAIRYEVEFKGERAAAARDALSQRGNSRWYTANVVANECSYRGLVLPLRASISERAPTPGRKPNSDVEGALVWLGSQVAPTVRRLLQVVDRDVILEALGLHEKE